MKKCKSQKLHSDRSSGLLTMMTLRKSGLVPCFPAVVVQETENAQPGSGPWVLPFVPEMSGVRQPERKGSSEAYLLCSQWVCLNI